MRSLSSSAATGAGSAAEQEDVPEVKRVDSLYSPHEVCEAAVDYVLRNVNTVQYMIQSIEEITGKPFLRNRIKCLPAALRAEASCGPATGLSPDRVYAGYMWRRARSDCEAKDVVLLEDHIAHLYNTKHAATFLKKDNGGDERTASSLSTLPASAGAASPPSASATPSRLERLLAGSQRPVLEQVERNLRHELVHAFDDARGFIESSDCVHQACSEIRAARLSGDCFVGQEMRKGRFNFFEGGQKCVRRRAVIAVDRNPVCRGFSERAVDTVFQKCYSDYEPFAAPIYALGSYGDTPFANGTMKFSPDRAQRARPSTTVQSTRSRYRYRCNGATDDVMRGSAVAASRPRGKSPGVRDRASKSRSPHSRTSNTQGAFSLHAAVSSDTSSRPPTGMPEASSSDFVAHARAHRRSKGSPNRLQKSSRTASSHSHKSKKTRELADGGSGAAARLYSANRSVFTFRGSAAMTATPGRNNQRNSRWVCRISEGIALNRIQRTARCFLMHRYLQRTVPAASVPVSRSGSLITESTAADAVPLLESRFLHRLRAALYREERAAELRTRIAKRVIQAALSRWAQAHRLQHRCLVLLSRVQTVHKRCPLRVVELEAALCRIQASLRTRESSCLVEARRVKFRQQTAVRVLERAWQKSPRYVASIRHIHDRQARDVLCRHEAVERRDILRRHFIFMVCCHQAFFNDPRMWDAGVAIRRIPLNTPNGLLSTKKSMLSGTAAFSSPLTNATADSVTLCGGAAAEKAATTASALQPETPPLSPAANATGSIGRRGLPLQPGSCPSQIILSSSRAGKEEEGGGVVDIDTAVRLGEYRLLFSPAEWRLLVEVRALPKLHLALSLCSDGADEQYVSRDAAEPWRAEGGAFAAHPRQLQVMADESVDNGASSLSYAQSFMSALTLLRQPRSFDASSRCLAQHLHDIRHSTAEMQQELRRYGYVSAALVAPFLKFGLHYQRLARGDADSSWLTSTAGMKMCRPLVAGRVACAATELRRCLIGATEGRGDAMDSALPVALEGYRCGFKAAARKPRRKPSRADVPAFAPSLPRARPTADFMRDGFSNPATEALYHPAEWPTRRAAVADPTRASPHQGSGTSSDLAIEWRRRLAVSAEDVGPYWGEFFVSAVVNAFVTIAGKQGETPGEANAARTAGISSAAPLPPALVPRGLESCLLPGSRLYLLRDFTPSRMRRHTHTRAGTPPPDTASAQAGASLSPPLSMSSYTAVHPGEWWDAVERLLLQEYTNRTELVSSEAAQRRSIDVLQRVAHSSEDELGAEA